MGNFHSLEGKIVSTKVFGKRVRRPDDMVDDVEFEQYSIEMAERQVNDFIQNKDIALEEIVAYKVKAKKKNEKVKKEVRGGHSVNINVDIMTVRIFLSYIRRDSFDEE